MTDSTFAFAAHRHPRPLAWAVSLAVHAAAVAAALLAGRGQPAVVPPPVRVTLVEAPPATVEPTEWPLVEPRPRSPRTPPAPLAPPQRNAVPVPPPAPTPPEDPRWRTFERESSRAFVRWWGDRSLAAWVEGWRRGTPEPDSLLDPAPPPADEVAREALDVALRREFLLRTDEWERERFLEAYRRSFPLMQ